MSIRARKNLFLVLVVVFFVQTWLVYTDPAGRATPPLSRLAAAGRAIWLEHNCQSCHQLYGFGGFLGPDLTNASERLTRARLDTVLSVGAGQMPAFHLSEQERGAVAAFLAAIHSTGIGQLRGAPAIAVTEILDQAIQNAVRAGGPALSVDEACGKEILLEQKCLGCHLPNPRSTKRATDMTRLVPKLGPDGIKAILGVGIPAKGMPRFDFVDADRDHLIAFLAWFARNADAVRRAFVTATPSPEEGAGLPWFEYTK